MPEFQLTDSIITSLNAQEPWPENVKLFQPYEVEQILLPDNASCLAVQAFLKMCNLPFEVEMRWNAEFMSPSGRVPFIKCGAFVVSELEPIVQFAANKGVSLCGKLSTEEKAEMRAYMSLITNVLVNAELYISWIDDETYNAVTKVRNSSVYPWPLGWLQTRAKRSAVAKRLRALHWGNKTLDQVLADVEQCCNSLSQRLGERDYFFGTTPTPLDALVYGHMRALLSANGPKAPLMIRPMTTSLLKFVVRMIDASGMNLTPQEEYLLTQAFHLSRRRMWPERTVSERSTRAKRSRLCIRNTSKENITYTRDTYGFKPFSSKQIIIMSSKEGVMTCKYNVPNKQSTTTFGIEENHNLAVEIVDDILEMVAEIATEYINVRYDEKNDFEIVYPDDEKFANAPISANDFLDTIEENDVTDTTLSMDVAEDLIQIINDDDIDNDYINDVVDSDNTDGMNNTVDSDGVNDKNLVVAVLNDSVKNVDSDVTDSSNNKGMKDAYLTESSSRVSKMSDKSGATPTLVASDSQATLKFPSDEEISVESLLKILRERKAACGLVGNYVEVAEID